MEMLKELDGKSMEIIASMLNSCVSITARERYHVCTKEDTKEINKQLTRKMNEVENKTDDETVEELIQAMQETKRMLPTKTPTLKNTHNTVREQRAY